MTKFLFILFLFQFVVLFQSRGAVVVDSMTINLPGNLADTSRYTYKILDDEKLAIVNHDNQHIIISNREGEILNELKCNDLKGRFSRDNRHNYPKVLSILYQGESLLILFRSQIHNFLRHSMNYYLIDYNLKSNEFSIQKWDLKLDGTKYELPFNFPNWGDLYFDSKRKVYYFTLAIDQGKDTGFRTDCQDWFKRSNKVGVVNENGRLVVVFAKYSPLYTEQHPCLSNIGQFAIAYNDNNGELAIQEAANPLLHLYDLDNRSQLTPFDTLDLDLPVVNSFYDNLVNGLHYFMTRDYFRNLTYDSVNNVYYRFFRPAITDTTSRDLEYERLLKQYFEEDLRVCPSVSLQKEAQKKMLREAPKYYQIFGEDGEMITSVKIPKWIESETYYGAPDIFYTEKGSIWVAETKGWVEKHQFKIYKLDLPGL